MNPIEGLLRREIGLDAASIGTSIIERIVRLRMNGRGLNTLADYQRFLAASPEEWDELIEAVVVTETWFFRDREPFDAFAQLVQQQWLPQHPADVLRILSVPCSSGEEPYSLAMTLLDANIPPDRFEIDAADISARALDRARRALYGKNSFRGKDLAFRDRYFQPTKDGYALHAHVRDCVQFHRNNLLSEDFAVGHRAYDFIFCRNLLIYFDSATQRRTLEKLRRILVADGVLFVGPAELPLVMENGFVSTNIPMAFACRKAVTATQMRHTGHAIKAPEPAPLPATPPPPPPGRSEPAVANGKPRQPNSAHAAPDALPGLDQARKLADAGKLQEAAARCEALLRDQGPSAQAYYLLGLVCDANGDPQAAEYYRKALYLDPNHYETLVQLSLLLEKGGDAAGARTLKRRAERVQQKA